MVVVLERNTVRFQAFYLDFSQAAKGRTLQEMLSSGLKNYSLEIEVA